MSVLPEASYVLHTNIYSGNAESRTVSLRQILSCSSLLSRFLLTVVYAVITNILYDTHFCGNKWLVYFRYQKWMLYDTFSESLLHSLFFWVHKSKQWVWAIACFRQFRNTFMRFLYSNKLLLKSMDSCYQIVYPVRKEMLQY